ncbi:MAG: stage II sporulation protein M [Actinomycetaceae bacterium]|nr:stage II sporulation protein M [Actinomycetaceae bacterium]
MDIDALKEARSQDWQTLHDLSTSRYLDGPKIDELARQYRLATADLANVRSLNPDADVIRSLSRDLGLARGRLTGVSGASLAAISAWFRIHLPSALYQLRWWTVGVMVAFIIVAALQMAFLFTNPELFALMGTESELTSFAKRDFVTYYSQDTNAEFGASVWFNNAFIAVQCIGGGITGIFPLYVLYGNAMNLGVTGSVVIQYGGVWHFFRFILPHGLPELTAIFIAGAAGLRIFWSMVAPGPKTRLQSIAETGRKMLVVSGGLVILLFISGILEGFVTPSALPDVIKISLGAAVTIGLWVYTFWVGGKAYRAGKSGDLDSDAGWSAPTAG